MKSADPRVKLLWVLLCTTGALMFNRPLWMLGLALFTLGVTVFFGGDLGALASRLRRFFPLLLFIIVLHMIFASDGLMRGATTLVRFFVILCSASVMEGESIRRVQAALTKLRIPYLFSFLLMIALRFIPTFRSSFSDALVALQLRGVEFKKIPFRKKVRMYGDLLLPVVADSVAKSRQLAIVMETRGFGAFPKRTSYLEVSLTLWDWILIGTLVGLGIIAFGSYYLFI